MWVVITEEFCTLLGVLYCVDFNKLIYKCTQCNITDDYSLCQHCCENLRSDIFCNYSQYRQYAVTVTLGYWQVFFFKLKSNLPLTEPGHNRNLSSTEKFYNSEDLESWRSILEVTVLKGNYPQRKIILVPCDSIIDMFQCIIKCVAENTCTVSGFSLKFL